MLQYSTECNAFPSGISMHLQPNMWQQLTGTPGSFAPRSVMPNLEASILDAVGLGFSVEFGYTDMANEPVGKREKPTGICTAHNDNEVNGHFNRLNTANTYPRPGGGPPARIAMGSSPGAGGSAAS